MRYSDLPLSAQTAYAELFAQTQAFELDHALSGLVGAFHKRRLKNKDYWYFAYRDIDQKLRMAYVGPDNERVRALVERFKANRRDKPLAPPARMAIAAGCAAAAPKHFRIIRRLAEYGFFRSGGILIGTHAFLAMGNMLGVRWRDGAATLDVDFAHADFFLSGLNLLSLSFDTQQNLPYDQQNPSACFTDGTGAQINGAGGQGTTCTNSVGAINGISGPNVMFLTDGNSSAVTVPEPATVALLGLGLIGLGLARRRNTPA